MRKGGRINDPESDEDDSSLNQPMLGKSRSSTDKYPHQGVGLGSSKLKKTRSQSITSSESSEESFSDSRSDSEASSTSDTSMMSEGSNVGGNRKKLINRKGFSKMMMHLKLLLLKNFWIFRRNLKLTLI
jgi:hypothetical protein